ncbi:MULTISPECIES: hypothetical protein [unclassified Spirosoma]|uniref:hypothetical protein n=1 Tax=unclassified Spirosoma TaxID=2621999 RepID=UPI000962B314|nr:MULTISPECIES: hypothetical protein [unclassified Spirosoma]MBN8820631.1 hypothetical protein [Spirosoma sp.]OJW70527.1 MAG: hypothetical protein BGO59_25155 [Spirosoma sp. 48-14]
MHQVQNFRANFSQDEVVDTTSDNLTDYTVGSTELHDIDSTVRNLCFVWENGRRAFFNYAYLVSVDLVITDNLNEILLYFSGHIVTLKGYQLSPLFDLLFDHSLKTIRASNPRYLVDGQTQYSLVTEILLKSE